MQQSHMVANVFQFPQIMGSNNGRQVAFFHISCKNTLYSLAHNRIQAVKGLVAEQVIGIGAYSADNGNLLFHALGKGVDFPLLIQFKIPH